MFKNRLHIILSLAIGLLILSHAIVPHDHHYDVSETSEHHNNQEENNNPAHCHLLNTLDYVLIKSNVQVSVKKTTPNFTFTLNDFNIRSLTKGIKLFVKVSIEKNYFYYAQSIPVRGSPFVYQS